MGHPRDAVWLRSLVSTGELALSLCVAHVVIGMGALEAAGRIENQTWAFSLFCSATFCLVAVVFAYLWRGRFRRGPIEALMRRLTS